MKHYIFTILSFFALCSCNSIDRQNKSFGIISNEIFMQETNDSTKTTKQILDNILPSVLALAKADTSSFYYGKNVIEDDTIFRQLLIGKLIDKTGIFAIEIDLKEAKINFFSLDRQDWKLVGSEKTKIPIYKIGFEDLNGDSKRNSYFDL